MLTLDRFKAARSVLQGVILETNLIHSPALSRTCGNNVYLKPENMQITGAYKIRGAYYKISTLSEEEKSRGLITASAGSLIMTICMRSLCQDLDMNYENTAQRLHDLQKKTAELQEIVNK